MLTSNQIVTIYFEGGTPEGNVKLEKRLSLKKGQASKTLQILKKYLYRKRVFYGRKNYEDAADYIKSYQENEVPSLGAPFASAGEANLWNELELAFEGVKIAVQKVLDSETSVLKKENRELKKQLAELELFREEAKKDNWIKSLQNRLYGNR